MNSAATQTLDDTRHASRAWGALHIFGMPLPIFFIAFAVMVVALSLIHI